MFVESSPLVESSRIKVGHVIFAINRTKVLHSLYGFGIVTRSIVLTSSLMAYHVSLLC